MGWYHDGWSSGWMVVMMVGWVGLIALAVWAVMALTRREDPPPQTPAARDILDNRFASGEISQTEYVEAKRLLEQPRIV